MPALALKIAGLSKFLAGIPYVGKLLGFLGIAAGKVGTAAATVAGIYFVVLIGLHLLTSALLAIAGALIPVSIHFNSKIVNAGFVRDGHSLVLSIANMGFIVALVVIAFGTMFRSEAFGYKKALPRLIIVAILINFGYFFVANIFIKPVSEITNSIWQAADFSGEFSPAVSTIFDPRGAAAGVFSGENFTIVCTENEGGEECKKVEGEPIKVPWFPDNVANALGSFVAGSLLGIIFAFISVIALFAFVVMMFIRGFALAFLIILMPLAWAGLIFQNLKIPGGGNPWKVWWESFIRWLLFAPFAMFFFFLAIKVANTTGGKDLLPAGAGGENDLITGIGQMIIVVGLLLGGLHVSNKMGITGSGYALAVASKGKVWVQGKVKQYGNRTKEIALRNKYSDKAITKLQDLGSNWKFGGRGFTAPIRAAGRGAATAAFGAERAVDEATMKKLEKLPPYAIKRMRDGLNERGRYVADLLMVKKGYEWEDTEQARKDWAKWEKEGRFDPRKGGNPLLSLDLLDKGVSTEVLAAQADLEKTQDRIITGVEGEVPKDASFKDKLDWVEYNRSRISSEDNAELERLEGILESSWVKAINIIGYRGLSQVNHRINSAPGSFQPWGDKEHPEFHNWYRENFTDHALDQIPGATNLLVARSRGDAADFIIERASLATQRLDDNFIKPILDEIKDGIRANIAAIGIDTSISDDVRERRISAKQEELARATNLALATPQDRDQWLQRHWSDLAKKAPQITARQTADRISSRFTQLFAAGKRAYFLPYAPGEGGAPPPPMV